MDEACLALKIVLVVLPYDPRVYSLYFVNKKICLYDGKESCDDVFHKYLLFEIFEGFELGSVDVLLEKVSVPAFLNYIFDGLFIGNFVKLYLFVKINRKWCKIPNLIVPFVFLGRETCDETLPLVCGGSIRKASLLKLCLDEFCCHWNLRSFNDCHIFQPIHFVRSDLVFPANFNIANQFFVWVLKTS